MNSIAAIALALALQEKGVGYDDTPQLPGQQWKVHDAGGPCRRWSRRATPRARRPRTPFVLFDGKDLSKWQRRQGNDTKWKVEDGYFEAVKGAGDIATRESSATSSCTSSGRRRRRRRATARAAATAASFSCGRYEMQVLDSYKNRTYADGQAARDLRPVAAAGQRERASPASGRCTTSSSRRRASRAARSTRRRSSPCSTTACCMHNTQAYIGADDAQAASASTASTSPRGRSAAGPRQPRALPQHLDPRD